MVTCGLVAGSQVNEERPSIHIQLLEKSSWQLPVMCVHTVGMEDVRVMVMWSWYGHC